LRWGRAAAKTPAMALFYIFAVLLALLAAAWLAWPLLRRMEPPAHAAAHGQAVYRDQLAELERDVARGLLSPEEEAAARAEIGRRMLAAERAAAGARASDAAPARVLAGAALLVPLLAAGIYAAIGRPDAPDRPLSARLEAGETQTAASDPQLEAAIAELSQRVRRDGADFESRVMLGRALMRSGRFEEALGQYAAARELTEGGDNVELLSEMAQVRVMANDGAVDAEAFALFRDVVEIDPDNPEARFYLGYAMAQYGEFDAARLVWGDLLEDSSPSDPWYSVVREQLAQLPAQNDGADASSGAPEPLPETE